MIAVLDHRLRVGDEATAEKIIAAHKARGLQPPDHVINPPQVKPEFFVYWEAFQDLQTMRVNPRGTIPIGAILDYSHRYGLNPDTVKRIVWAVDRTLLEHWKRLDEADKADKDQGDRRGIGA